MINHNDNITKKTNILNLNDSHVINIEKFMLIIRNDIDLGLSLLTLFKQQAYEHLDNLKYALTLYPENSNPLFEITHAIKGASLSIAADKITDLSRMIEQKIHNKETVTPDNYNSLIHETKELLNYITMIEARKTFL